MVRVVRIANSCSDLGQPGGRLDALNYTEILLVTGIFPVSYDDFTLFSQVRSKLDRLQQDFSFIYAALRLGIFRV